MKGKLIVIEGTDCSGKETQTKLLVERLKKEGKKVANLAFPMYETPTGRIIGACLIGKPHMCKEYLKSDHGFFPEGGGEVDSLTALLYYAADRRYNVDIINKYLSEGYTLIIDRYVPSNMAHRGGMIELEEERLKMYQKIEKLEYDILELPKPDQVIFLYLPFEYASILKQNRKEEADETEKDTHYLKRGEEAYLELAKMYNYDKVMCVDNSRIKTIEEIHEEVYKLINIE